ncbi:MAG: hypothetical protein JRN67_11870, partial [Nitrososphaerota archaeon]|nr:hypothetical protein [Nitrososphaerota archaeon]
ISLSFLPSFFSNVSYNITSGFSGPTNTESQRAQDILNSEFPSTVNNTASNSIIVLVQNTNPYADSLKNEAFALNQTLSQDSSVVNYTGMNSVYSTEYGLLNSSLTGVLPQVGQLVANISSINNGLYSLQQNLSALSI